MLILNREASTGQTATLNPLLSLDHYKLDLLSKPQLKLFNPDIHDSEWFTKLYQSRTQKSHPEYYSLKTVLLAVSNSEERFRQYPVDEKTLKSLARSIFTEDLWLQRDIVLGRIDGDYFVIGGRHRVNALVNVFAQYVRDKYKELAWTDKDRQEVFLQMLEQHIRCEVLHMNSLEDLLVLINVDNDSRVMRRAEQTHLLAQAYGADAESVDSIGKAVLGHDLDPTEAVHIAAQSFVRRPSKLKPQTKQVIGERVAKFILFGTGASKKLSTQRGLRVSSVKEFEDKMDRSWELLEEMIEGKEIVAANAKLISKHIVEVLESEELGQTQGEETSKMMVDHLGEIPEVSPTPRRGRKKST